MSKVEVKELWSRIPGVARVLIAIVVIAVVGNIITALVN